jgi:hypothetical protein
VCVCVCVCVCVEMGNDAGISAFIIDQGFDRGPQPSIVASKRRGCGRHCICLISSVVYVVKTKNNP